MAQDQIREYLLEGAPLNERLRLSIDTGGRDNVRFDLLQVADGKFVVVRHSDSKIGVVSDITLLLERGQKMSMGWTLLGRPNQSAMTAGIIESMMIVRPGATSNISLVNLALASPNVRWYAPAA